MGSYNQQLLKFSQLMAATSKTVNIDIAEADLQDLKSAGYKLCFAKKVGDFEYNVVWQSYDKYLPTNQFEWTPVYQIFGTNTFKSDITVKVSTGPVDIGLGQTTVLNEFGLFQKPVDGGSPTALNLDNQYGSIHPGVNQLSTGIDGSRVSTPIYVAANPIVKGMTELTPVEKVLVWFEQNIKTSTMFSTSRSNAVEIDLTNSNNETRLYSNQEWKTI